MKITIFYHLVGIPTLNSIIAEIHTQVSTEVIIGFVINIETLQFLCLSIGDSLSTSKGGEYVPYIFQQDLQIWKQLVQ